jgi:3-deoxy-D-manno-octulosonic-acid transferase
MTVLYHLGIRLYGLFVFLASWFSPKAKLWIQGRKNWREKVRRLPQNKQAHRGQWVWVHCSSLGEFEQGRPLIEGLKERMPEQPILLTFFSPSGYEIRKNYPQADHILYLPLDTPRNARDFLDLFQPRLAVFVKYDLWYFYIRELHHRQIPTLLISGLFREKQVYFQGYGAIFRKMLRRIDYFFLQNQTSADLLMRVGLKHWEVNGDTRIDRVAQLAEKRKDLPLIESFSEKNPVFIAGSTWPSDLKILVPFLQKDLPADWKIIIAPHEIGEASLQQTEKSLSPLSCIRYSRLEDADASEIRCLIIDNIGMLSSLYAYGKLAFIGGGFQRSGIHNTLEPAVFGLPIFLGPNYTKFEEAVEMVKRQAAFPVQTTEELRQGFNHLSEEERWEKASREASGFIRENVGATKRILNHLEQSGWLEKKVI